MSSWTSFPTLLFSEHIQHSCQSFVHIVSWSETPVEGETGQGTCLWPQMWSLHSMTRDISHQHELTLQQNGQTSATGGKKFDFFFNLLFSVLRRCELRSGSEWQVVGFQISGAYCNRFSIKAKGGGICCYTDSGLLNNMREIQQCC